MNAPIVMTYSNELAAKAGGGDFLTEGGAHTCVITQAKYVTAGTGSAGVEFSLETEGGQKANFINIYYAKKAVAGAAQGEAIKGGQSILHAMMGVLRLNQMTAIRGADGFVCPEFAGKKIGLFLQKKLTTKSNGNDSYGFEIIVPYNPIDLKTMREILDNKPAQTIDRISKSYKDRDERQPLKTASGSDNFGASTASSDGGGYYDNDPGFQG